MDQRDRGTAHGLIARILGRTGQACRLHAMQTSKRIEAAKGLLDSAKAVCYPLSIPCYDQLLTHVAL